MKYIKTKDGVFERMFPNEEQRISFDHKTIEPAYFTTKYEWVAKREVIKEVDTIEELCDEFVEKWKSSINRGFYHIVCNAHIRRINNETKMNLKNVQKGELEIYGAIWTDKGLIYVAKMNEKGELELL